MIRLITLFSAALFLSTTVLAVDDKTPVPQNASTAWVSNNLNQDGMLLAIKTFYSTDSVEDVLGFYRDAWHKDGDIPGYVENTMGDWMVISQLRDDSNVVLQLKTAEDGSTEGFLSKATKNPVDTRPDIDFPLPEGSERFSVSYTEEEDAQVHTMTFLSTETMGNTVSFYKQRMPAKGWQLAREELIEGNQVMFFNRKGDRCELVVSQLDAESTVIHVNRVKRNG